MGLLLHFFIYLKCAIGMLNFWKNVVVKTIIFVVIGF